MILIKSLTDTATIAAIDACFFIHSIVAAACVQRVMYSNLFIKFIIFIFVIDHDKFVS